MIISHDLNIDTNNVDKKRHFMKFLIIIINDDDVSISLICIKMIFLTHVVLKFFGNFPNACKIELHALREAGTFIRVDTETCLHPAYFNNPVKGLLVIGTIKRSKRIKSKHTGNFFPLR